MPLSHTAKNVLLRRGRLRTEKPCLDVTGIDEEIVAELVSARCVSPPSVDPVRRNRPRRTPLLLKGQRAVRLLRDNAFGLLKSKKDADD